MIAPKLTGCRCQCCACGEYFGNVVVFDRHRVGQHGVDRRCLSPTEMSTLGWVQNDRGFWLRRPLKRGPAGVNAGSNRAPATTLEGV
jgi:hypothetical protein